MQMMHPIVIVAYCGGLGLLCMVLFHPLFLLVALIMQLVHVRLHGAWNQLREWLWAYVLMALTIMVWNPLFSHRGDRVLFYVKDTPIVLESIIYGFTMMLLVVCVLVLFQSYHALMGSLKFLYIFSKVSPKIAVMTAMAVRFVPLLRRRLSMIIDVQRTRGISLRQGSLLDRLKNGTILLQITLVLSLEEAMHTADALTAKGYGSGPRSSYDRYRFSRRDHVVLGLIMVLVVWCSIGWLYGYGVMRIYPIMDNHLMDNGVEWLQLFSFIIYLSIPLLVEGRERFRWQHS
jgi:energy-coupling factor transport system permease protein